uniref:Uncharacterized protein n=1 Tax=Solanum lycopersicum TaxID=4081 RepID=A0A3Q7FAM9_SOLLC
MTDFSLTFVYSEFFFFPCDSSSTLITISYYGLRDRFIYPRLGNLVSRQFRRTQELSHINMSRTFIERQALFSAIGNRDIECFVVVVSDMSSIPPRPISLGGIVASSPPSDTNIKQPLRQWKNAEKIFRLTSSPIRDLIGYGYESGESYRLEDAKLQGENEKSIKMKGYINLKHNESSVP